MERSDREIEMLIKKDPDFINSKKHDYSLSKVLSQNPNGVAPILICRFLKIDNQSFPNILQEILDKLQKSILSY